MKKYTLSAVCLCALYAVGFAEEETQKSTIKNSLSSGLTLTDGNKETLQFNASFLSEGEKPSLGSFRAGLEGNYGESTVASNTETTVKNARAFANAKKTLTSRTFAALNGSVVYDDIAKIDYRAIVGPALGVYLIKTDKTKFSVEAGASYLWEKVSDKSSDYLVLRASDRFEYAFAEKNKIWQEMEYLPKADDFDNYLLNAEVGAEAALNSWLSLRVVFQDKYNNAAPAGLKKNDLSLIASLSVSL